MRRLLFALPILLIASLGLTSCEVFPSGCVKIKHYELPYPYVWDAPSGSVTHAHDLWPIQYTFVGVSGQNPQIWFSDTWHGPSNFTGWAEYASARICYETGGQASS